MVQCHGCKAVLVGQWAINTAGYVDGTYLGVSAYFAYSSAGWVYSYCSNCYNNGKMFQDFYHAKLQNIKSQFTVQQKTLFEKNINDQIKITNLQSTIKGYEKLNQLNKTQQKTINERNLKISSLEAKLIELEKTYEDKLKSISDINTNLKEKNEEMMRRLSIIEKEKLFYEQIFPLNTAEYFMRVQEFH